MADAATPALANAPVDAKHPAYEQAYWDWAEMRDAVAGGTRVKMRAHHYLPLPSGFAVQNDKGQSAYHAYKLRAQFPDITEPTIRGMLGVIHRMASKIELPPALEYLREKATADGMTLEAFHRRITREVLTTGRYGVLTDVANEGPDKNPYLSGYSAESIINWSSMSDLFVLDETGNVRNGYWWVLRKQWRVLEIVNGIYTVGVFGDATLKEGIAAPMTPQASGGKPLTEIPFVVIGPLDLTPELDEIPLLAVARAAYAEYRLDADYRHQLYMSGQETLFIVGNLADDKDVPTVVGASVIINLPEGADAKYVGPSGTGINAHRQAIQDERMNAVMAGARMFDSSPTTQAQSGDALRIRWAAQTATLLSVAMTTAQGLEKALRYAAMYVSADPNAVVVTPNTSFVDSDMSPADAAQLVNVWQSGTLSHQTVYEKLQKGGVANPDRAFDEEQQLIDEQAPALGTITPSPTGGGAGNFGG